MLSASLACLDDWLDEDATKLDITNNQNDEELLSLESFSAAVVSSVVFSSTRRALVYPYLRNMGYALHVWRHVCCLLQRGLRPVLRSLLQTRSILLHSELYYMGNKLFVDPYLAWLQASPRRVEDQLKGLATSVDNVISLTDLKTAVNLDLYKLEAIVAEPNSVESNDNSSTESKSDTSSGGESEGDISEDESTCKADPIVLDEIARTVKAEPNGINKVSVVSSNALLDDKLKSIVEDIAVVPSAESGANELVGSMRKMLIQELDST
jgi:hypothetical protein